MHKLNQDQIVHIIKADTEIKGDELCMNALCEQVYDGAGNLTEMVRKLVIEQLSHLILPGSIKNNITVTREGGKRLDDVCEWLSEDSGIIVNEADIQHTVASWLQDKASITDGLFMQIKVLVYNGSGAMNAYWPKLVREKR